MAYHRVGLSRKRDSEGRTVVDIRMARRICKNAFSVGVHTSGEEYFVYYERIWLIFEMGALRLGSIISALKATI
jgi:hypothetical protein